LLLAVAVAVRTAVLVEVLVEYYKALTQYQTGKRLLLLLAQVVLVEMEPLVTGLLAVILYLVP